MEVVNNQGKLFGIGVGPGPAGFIPLAAWQALELADVIYIPKAEKSAQSIARLCLNNLSLPEKKIREIVYSMDDKNGSQKQEYTQLANDIAFALQENQNVAYLTLGDPFTYSTYIYLLNALRKVLPVFEYKTFPGITSFAATAAALNWPLGFGKERILILPCPDNVEQLKKEIENHDVVVLMKIGKRLPIVLQVLKQMNISQHCALASRLGLPGEVLTNGLKNEMQVDDKLGYLTTMLISKTDREKTIQ